MTNPDTPLVARLAAAMKKVAHGDGRDRPRGRLHVGPRTAGRILAADPQLAAALDLGLAWQEAEAALPEGAWLHELIHWKNEWQVTLGGVDLPDALRGEIVGLTPAAALHSLADRLRDSK